MTRQSITNRLHRYGIARTLNSRSSNYDPNVTYLVEGRPWTPRWLIVWATNINIQWMYPSRAPHLRLNAVERHQVSVNGTRRWTLNYRPTHPGATTYRVCWETE